MSRPHLIRSLPLLQADQISRCFGPVNVLSGVLSSSIPVACQVREHRLTNLLFEFSPWRNARLNFLF
jgi:hypothetical protein